MNKLLLWCNLLAGTCFANMTWAQPNAILADFDYQGQPLTTNVSKPYRITAGLEGRHLSVWASHGLYYEAKRNSWQWQRPPLFGTNEDLFTPTIVLPYLIPMLEKSGAIVLSPRERDIQTEEVPRTTINIRRETDCIIGVTLPQVALPTRELLTSTVKIRSKWVRHGWHEP